MYHFIRLSFYNTSISISQPENRRLSTMYCIAKISNVLFPFSQRQFHFITDQNGRLLCINGNNTESLPEYTAELLCKEISTLGYCCSLRKNFCPPGHSCHQFSIIVCILSNVPLVIQMFNI